MPNDQVVERGRRGRPLPRGELAAPGGEANSPQRVVVHDDRSRVVVKKVLLVGRRSWRAREPEREEPDQRPNVDDDWVTGRRSSA